MTRRVAVAVVALAVALAGAAARAEELNLAARGTERPNVVSLRVGLEHGFVAEAGYRRVLSLGGRRLLLGGDVALPWATPDMGDYRVRLVAGTPLLGARAWRLAARVAPSLHATANAAGRMHGLGVDLRLTGGYYAPRWFAAGEAGLDWIATTHVALSERYRASVYDGAEDGWYAGTGGTFVAGLVGGLALGGTELVLRVGRTWHLDLGAQTVPFYVTVGVNVPLR